MKYTDWAETQTHINYVNQKDPDIKQALAHGINVNIERKA